MPENIEIKARASDWVRQVRTARALAGRTERLRQEDVFFNCANGRLKLRRQAGGSYLVFYRRAEAAGPKVSSYTIVPVAAPAAVLRLLSRRLGESGRVVKERLVCHAGRTRIHLDEVKGLGRFIELEVVLRPGEARARGRLEAGRLMRRLGIRKSDLVACAYADLLAGKEKVC